MQTCVERSLVVGNTFQNQPAEQTVSYYEIGKSPLDIVTASAFAELDLALLPFDQARRLLELRSDRLEALASHHFLVEAVYDVMVWKVAAARMPEGSERAHAV